MDSKDKGVDNARSPFYKDVAIIRFNPSNPDENEGKMADLSELGPSVQVVTDTGLMYIF
jgi:hypothetical protein